MMRDLFAGLAKDMDAWLLALNLRVPKGIQSIEFMLDLASGSVATQTLCGEICRQRCIQFAWHFACMTGHCAFTHADVPTLQKVVSSAQQVSS